MFLHLPRRHRRKLLLPPGLLALAGLLLLGCLALRPWQERLTRRNVLQLTMPPANASQTIWPIGYVKACDSLLLKEPKLTYANVLTYRNWFVVSFGQGQLSDTLAVHKLKTFLCAKGPEPGWKRNGLRVCFAPQASYSCLIMTISILNRFNIQQYFLDIRNKPTALYALTVPQSRCPPMPE